MSNAANRVNKNTSDAKSPVGTCPHRQDKVQLLPVRYALVEQADISPIKNVPYALKTRPVGIRLIRDGWLYIYESTGLFYEYKLTNGIPSELLWCHKTIPDANQRTRPQQTNPKLIFNRNSTLYICYSEVQWTILKCQQVLESAADRQHFMQKIPLSAVDCATGGEHLMTQEQANEYLADRNKDRARVTEPLQKLEADGLISQSSSELSSYPWEENHNSQILARQAGVLATTVDSQYQQDHLYLIVRDDTGLLKDLANYQDTVIGWHTAWQQNQETYKKYITGSYIESLYVINDGLLTELAAKNDKIRAFNDDTTEEQRQTVYDYLAVRNEDSWRTTFPSEENTGFLEWTFRCNNARKKMQKALGDQRYARHQDTIEILDENSGIALNGAKAGQRGIQDLVNRPAMEDFLARQRPYLQFIEQQLTNINQDRRLLFNQYAYFKAAWYYCARSKEQTIAFFNTEFTCYRDLGINQATLRDIATLREEDPRLTYPLLFTLPLARQEELTAQLLTNTQTLRGLFLSKTDYDAMLALSDKIRHLLSNEVPHLFNPTANPLLGHSLTLHDILYAPAEQLKLAESIMAAQSKIQHADITEIIRSHYPKSPFYKLIVHYKSSGLTINFASAAQINAFMVDWQQASQLITERNNLKKDNAHFRRQLRQANITAADKAQLTARIAASEQRFTLAGEQLLATERRLANAMSATPGDQHGKGRLGFSLQGLNPRWQRELFNMSEDLRAGATLGILKSPPAPNFFKSIASPVSGDFWNTILFFWKLNGFVGAVREESAKGNTTTKDKILALVRPGMGFAAATFGMLQGFSATALTAAMDGYQSSTMRINSLLKFGALTELFGFFSYGLGMINATASSLDHANELITAINQGNGKAQLGALTALAGSGGQLAMNTWGTARSAGVISRAFINPQGVRTGLLMESAASLRFLGRFTLITLGFTALECAGSWLYNRYNLTELDSWLLHSPWGREPAGVTLTEQDLRLNQATTVPQVSYLINKSNQHFQYQFTLPNLTANSLNGSGLMVSVTRNHGYGARPQPEAYSEDFVKQLQLISEPDAPLTLAFDILRSEASLNQANRNSFGLTLKYPVTFQPETVFAEQTYYFHGWLAHDIPLTLAPLHPEQSIVWHKSKNFYPITLEQLVTD